MMNNLKFEKKAVIDLIKDYSERIFLQIFKINDKKQKINLIKVMVNLILEISQEICSSPEIFLKMMNLIMND